MGRNENSFSGGQWNVLELEIARFFEETTRLGWPTVADEEARQWGEFNFLYSVLNVRGLAMTELCHPIMEWL